MNISSAPVSLAAFWPGLVLCMTMSRENQNAEEEWGYPDAALFLLPHLDVFTFWVQNHNRDMARLGYRQLETSQPQSESGKQK